MEELIKLYESRRDFLKERLSLFSDLHEGDYFKEFIFCLLTPQSNAKKCWNVVEEIFKSEFFEEEKIREILKKNTRFHNNKTKYLMDSKRAWSVIKENLSNVNRKELRNFISENVKGYGLKEAGHFLRNIGKSDNQIAILDRHILRNLADLRVISTDEINIKNKAHYLSIENKFISFSKEIKIPIDHLDLAFWS